MKLQFKNSDNEIDDPSKDHIEGAILALPVRLNEGFLGQSVIIFQDDDNWLGINSTHIQGSYQVVKSLNGKQFQTNEFMSLEDTIVMAINYALDLDCTDDYKWKHYSLGDELKKWF